MADPHHDAKDVALAALADLARLMGAELVAGSHRDDIDRFEAAVRAKLGAIAVSGCAPEVAAAGLALAQEQAERVLRQIRVQARAARGRDLAAHALAERPSAVLH